MARNSDGIEQMDRQIEAEFVDEVRDILSGIEVLLGNMRSKSVPPAEGLTRIRREMLNVEVRGASLDQPMVTIVAHRLDEYLSDLKTLGERELDDVQTFIDQIRQALDGQIEATAGAKIVRELPARKMATFNPADVKVTDVEVLLVIPDKAMARIVERELAACGYRTSNVASPFQALETAVRIKPDLVIVAGLLDHLSGVDLAAALTAMPATRTLPVALLTSFAWGHPSLQDLPPRVPLIRKGPSFGDDLAEALARLHIT